MNESLNGEVTFVIKTFERPECLRTLVKSILKYYKDVPIIIVDDSKLENKEKYLSANENIQYLKIDYDQGISFGRNIAITKVKTKYFLLLDDDMKFYRKTDVKSLLDISKKWGFDIVGGALKQNGIIRHLESSLELIDGKLVISKDNKNCIDDKVYQFDWIFNFFIAKKNSIIKNGGWDNKLKSNEHLEFFIRAKKINLKVGYTPKVIIKHIPKQSKAYKKIRYTGYLHFVLEKHGIKEIVWPRKKVSNKIVNLIRYILDKSMEKIRSFK